MDALGQLEARWDDVTWAWRLKDEALVRRQIRALAAEAGKLAAAVPLPGFTVNLDDPERPAIASVRANPVANLPLSPAGS